jgi:HPt (histidine-containing phosphotransfer) domain-containing protein
VTPDVTTVLDRQQLRDAALDDDQFMRKIVRALIDETSRQIPLLEAAIREKDPSATRRLAHYSKGACANVGARSAAAALEDIERTAARSDFDECAASLGRLAQAIDRLRAEAFPA